MRREWELKYSHQTKQTLKNIKKEKEGHSTMIKGSIQEEDTTIINLYAPYIGASKFIK